MRPAETQWLILVLILVAGLGYYAYKNWNAAPPNTIVGKTWVIDGDTVVINNIHIRLEGIDAPESAQMCTEAGGGS
jgi:endonuclease YncB( thermonuclease family)